MGVCHTHHDPEEGEEEAPEASLALQMEEDKARIGLKCDQLSCLLTYRMEARHRFEQDKPVVYHNRHEKVGVVLSF